MFDFIALAQQCAPAVAPPTMAAVARVESAHNPYAIGVVGGRGRFPKTLDEAVRTAEQLEAEGKNFSLGIAQVNRYNLARHKLDYRTAFEPCANLRAGAAILADCYVRASKRYDSTAMSLKAALSCYYSGNFKRGFVPDEPGGKSYVDKVLAAAGEQIVPDIREALQPLASEPQPVRLQASPKTESPRRPAPPDESSQPSRVREGVPVRNPKVVL
jgi:type IV secretion system protein VirB1